MRTLLLAVVVTLFITACEKEDTTETSDPQDQDIQLEAIPFTGNWQRQFEAGPGNLHTVNYAIYQDSIHYTLSGNIGNADYVMQRDTFLLDNNRFIGHTNSNQYYLLFVKHVSNDSIALYKQEVADVPDGMSITVPSDTTTANHGWNTYYKSVL